MRIVPYVSIAEMPFGCDEAVVLAAFGKPHQRELNRHQRLELAYGSHSFRFAREGGALVEVTASAASLAIAGCVLPGATRAELAFVELGYAMAKLDPGSFLAHGFIVSPRFGMAFDPHAPSFVTAFARSELAGWQDLA